ncbi:AAA family ATPase [Falsiroseomonas sp. HC035]|uniref:AAA family ATPase n=1 Tax=Falsiroseomonas sp. HC035 TaxID=3390999 RepID=UPI003D320620
MLHSDSRTGRRGSVLLQRNHVSPLADRLAEADLRCLREEVRASRLVLPPALAEGRATARRAERRCDVLRDSRGSGVSFDQNRKRGRKARVNDPVPLPLIPRAAIAALEAHLVTHVIGGAHLVRGLLIALLADGHVLIDGPPGLAKTRVVTALAEAIEATFRRVALGPGQRMSHLFGAEASVASLQGAHDRQPDPVFANILLAEGVDGAAPEVRLALLDAMTERQVMVGGVMIRLPDVFLVCATRTLIHTPPTAELLGLNERDRFLLHLRVDYPDEAHERRMLDLIRTEDAPATRRAATMKPLPLTTLLAARAGVQAVRTGPRSLRWITALVAATRGGRPTRTGPARWIRAGAGPRGSIALERCARAHAWLSARQQVTARDIIAVAHDVLRHRLDLVDAAKEADITPDSVITDLLVVTRP